MISGASSGIGNACATFLAKKGYRVYGAVRDPEIYERNADEFFSLVKMDVTDEDSVRRAVQELLDKEGRINALVCCAGVCLAGSAEDSSIADYREQMETDFLGTVRLVRACLPVMRSQGYGRIISFGALESRYGMPFHPAFAAAKAATEAFSLSMRMELKPFGVDACVISPIDIRTGFTASRRMVAAWTAASPYNAYGSAALDKKKIDERRGLDPIKTARLVRKLIAARTTRPRYIIGNQFRRFPMGRAWSTATGLAEFFACRYYGLKNRLGKRGNDAH